MIEAFAVTLPKYEGPFDLLLDAIREDKIDIFEISLSQIISAYFEYLNKLKELDLNLSSEFLLTAAYLLEMKSKRLLPQPEEVAKLREEEEIESDLAEHIREYQRFKQAAEHLRSKKESFSRIYSRFHSEEQTPEEKNFFLTDVNLNDLVLAFKRVYNSISEEEKITEIKNDEITLPQRIEEVIEILKKSTEGVEFERLFVRRTRLEVVVTFLAILELCRRARIKIFQEEGFSGIYLRLI
jgi:segregation and condensation protein A